MRQVSSFYGFQGFILDTHRRKLLKGAQEVPLRPKAFALLELLARNAPGPVERPDVLRAIWPGRSVVSDDSVHQLVADLRRALGSERQLVRTLPDARLVLDAEVALRESDEQTAWETALPPLPPERTVIVVLPFDAAGGSGNLSMANGLTADLIVDLTRYQSLQVLSPGRGEWRRGAEWSAILADPVLPARPGLVPFVVAGSVQRSRNRVRVTARLVGAQAADVLWTDRFDRPLDDLFALQDELSSRIAACLVSRIEQEETRWAWRRPHTDLLVRDLHLRARELHSRSTAVDTHAARNLLSRALSMDPGYAPAHAWLAYTLQRGFTHGWGEPCGPEALALALEHAEWGVRLDPNAPLNLACLSFILLLLGRHQASLETARNAVALHPSSWIARFDYGIVLTQVAEDASAGLLEVQTALMLDPFHPPWARYALGFAMLLAGDAPGALNQLRWCAERLPDYLPGRESMVVAAVESGQLDQARRAAEHIVRLGRHWTMRKLRVKWSYFRPSTAMRFHAAFTRIGFPP